MAGNRLYGAKVGPTIVGQSIYDESVSATTWLGSKLQVGDRTFRYVKNGAATLKPGVLCQGPVGLTTHKNLAVAAAAGVNQNTLTVTVGTGDLTLNQLKDGWLGIYDVNASLGMTYRIKSNTAAVATAATTIVLYDDLLVALTMSDKVCYSANRYNGVIIAPATTATADAVGVPIIDVTALYYFWIQTSGPVTCLADGAWTFGGALVRSLATAGALAEQVAGAASLAAQEIAISITNAATTKSGLCNLRLE